MLLLLFITQEVCDIWCETALKLNKPRAGLHVTGVTCSGRSASCRNKGLPSSLQTLSATQKSADTHGAGLSGPANTGEREIKCSI